MSCASFEITAHHSRHSSLSSLEDDNSFCERRSSYCSTPSNPESFASPAIAILASSSPEINALCKVPHVLTISDARAMEFPLTATPSPTTKKYFSQDETNSTTIASSFASWEGNDSEQLPDFIDHLPTDHTSPLMQPMNEDVALAWVSGGKQTSPRISPKPRRVSLSPDANHLEELACQLGGISLHTTDRSFRIRRPSLHRRVSHDMLPSPDQIAAAPSLDYPPPRYPALQRGVSCPNVSQQPRRRHRRNTTQIVLPPQK